MRGSSSAMEVTLVLACGGVQAPPSREAIGSIRSRKFVAEHHSKILAMLFKQAMYCAALLNLPCATIHFNFGNEAV